MKKFYIRNKGNGSIKITQIRRIKEERINKKKERTLRHKKEEIRNKQEETQKQNKTE